ncbi:fatty acid desaturase [Tenuibacillus multivorans]|uniref:Omega-6 fatty acid desaturase (Delta-12 desaturase) n=1 Tax=Tenuibacillus multivorans TaxID=237069 RepID=A0A1H0DV39_9BACI|nr:fatty acid desaturase [Tenuibacillus multivorans]GEL76769.1 fatty acid desaturase [Tenuibacillus multivorans]SDN73995.1 omega-6 fatty acid desaturase (delta-12 desaturase) [Tenuibacillus multivorans]
MSHSKLAQLKKNIRQFEQSDAKASVWQLINTIPPLFILWYLAYESISVSIWLSLALSILAAGFVVRTFIIFHDCCHGSFFKNRKLNHLIGTVTGILTMFPYSKWKREHSIHHATSSNLDKRGTGDVWIMTVNEYVKASKLERLQYRLYRNPFVMFVLGPLFLFFVSNRMNRKDAKKKERRNTYLTNVSIVAIAALLIVAIGLQNFLIVQIPVMFVAGSLGIWLFYVQHQFEDSYFEDEAEWDYVKAAIDGSSYYKLPRILQWITGNIGYHHVHHLSPKVPNYHLEDAHESTPPLQQATTITMKSSLKSIHFRLYDEDQKMFVSFKGVKPLLKESQHHVMNQKESV